MAYKTIEQRQEYDRNRYQAIKAARDAQKNAWRRDHQEQVNEAARDTYAQRRDDWFADKCCVRCGATDHLELDHKDASSKSFEINWKLSWERLEPELAKCQVLCHDCHGTKTGEYGDKAPGKLTTAKAHEIKLLMAETKWRGNRLVGKYTDQEIADMYGVSRATICLIAADKLWKDA
jgi:hypothetical protein